QTICVKPASAPTPRLGGLTGLGVLNALIAKVELSSPRRATRRGKRVNDVRDSWNRWLKADPFTMAGRDAVCSAAPRAGWWRAMAGIDKFGLGTAARPPQAIHPRPL